MENFKIFLEGFLSSLAFSISIYAFGYLILKEKNKSVVYNIAIFLLSVILYNIIFLTMDGILKSVLFAILFTFTFKLLFSNSFLKSLFASIAFIVILIIPDLLVTFGLMLLVGKQYFYSVLAGGILCNLFVSLIMIILIFILRKPLRKIMNHKLTENKKIIITEGLILITLLILFYNLIKIFRTTNNILAYIIIITSLIYMLGYLMKQRLDNEKISKKYDELLDVMKEYENDIEEQRTFIHETRNEFATIRSKLSDKEKKEEIIKYIDSVTGDKVSSNMSKYSKFMYLPKNGLKGFLYYKCSEATKKNIRVKVNISKQIENSFLKDLETNDFKNMVRILGVFLDNAIEAASIAQEKKVSIEIYLIKEKIEIIISNTFNNDINLDKIGNEKYTTKGKNRGHGLLFANKIVRENDMFETKNDVKNNIYIQTLKIKNKN